MIKITKKDCPSELTDLLKKELTETFKKTGKSVWKKPFIEKALLESSHNKCCYCECKIDRESKYMEVEHYNDKDTYPDLVVEWDNLLPSCKRCNGHKSTYDTVKSPFINPATMDPKDHVIISAYRFYPKTIEGKQTIEELLLNDQKRLVTPRFEITDAILHQLAELRERAEEYSTGERKTGQNRKRILTTLENLMYEGLPTAEYTATVSTSMINNVDFIKVIEIVKEESLWNDELESLLSKLKESGLDTNIIYAKRFSRSREN